MDEVIWPGIWNPDWDKRFEELYGYDPGQGQGLLAEAGYKNGFEFTMYLYTLPGLPEQVDIGQAIALDFEAVGLKPKLVEIDFPRVREQYRTKTIHGALWPGRNALRALETARIFNKAKDSVVYAYEHPYIEERLEALAKWWTGRSGPGCCAKLATMVSPSLLPCRCFFSMPMRR